jgi:hypothetical protein
MLKNYSKIDLTFLVFLFLFSLLGIYELIKLITPHYTFFRAVIVFFIVSWVYFWYKNWYKTPKLWNTFKLITHWGEKLRSFSRQYKNTWEIFVSVFEFIVKKKDYIVYISFIILTAIVLIWILFDISALFAWALGLFFIVYILMKLLGFTLTTKIQKSEIRDMNSMRLFLVSFAVFFIVMKLICDSFSLPEGERTGLYILFSFIYIIGWFLTFFRYNFSFTWLLRPYNVLSVVLVCFLVALLWYNNGLWEVLKEKFVPTHIVQEDMNLPWIISDEVQIWDKQEIQYKQTLVSSVYNIEDWLSLWSSWESVVELQKVLGNLQYFIWEVSGSFDEETRVALRDTLIWECDWPESTSWIFGPQAKQCIDSLKISVPKNVNTQVDSVIIEEIISSEV